jgi:hypothetical protein
MTTMGKGFEESAAKFTRFINNFLASDLVHRVRGSILESATTLEFQINEALAAWLSGNIATSDELANNVLSRLPVDTRLHMLRRRMKETGALERWPLLVPVLERVFDLRNRYAHGHISPLPNGGVRIVSWNRGRGSVAELAPDELAWLAYEARIASVDLARLWAYWVPDDPAWHEI